MNYHYGVLGTKYDFSYKYFGVGGKKSSNYLIQYLRLYNTDINPKVVSLHDVYMRAKDIFDYYKDNGGFEKFKLHLDKLKYEENIAKILKQMMVFIYYFINEPDYSQMRKDLTKRMVAENWYQYVQYTRSKIKKTHKEILHNVGQELLLERILDNDSPYELRVGDGEYDYDEGEDDYDEGEDEDSEGVGPLDEIVLLVQGNEAQKVKMMIDKLRIQNPNFAMEVYSKAMGTALKFKKADIYKVLLEYPDFNYKYNTNPEYQLIGMLGASRIKLNK